MEFRRLGKSGLMVSEIGLGGNNFGWRVDEQTSISLINSAIDLGINFIDTAELYGQGNSEEFVGKGIKGKRSQLIIATKFGMTPDRRFGSITRGRGPSDGNASRAYIIKALEGSLKKLNTDYIDLYQVHFPDPITPIEETLRTLDELVKSGKVRYIGCSNFAAWQLTDAIWTSRVNNLNSFISEQSEYNLLNRSIEQELIPACQMHGIGVIPSIPLASGFLTGKYIQGKTAPQGTRIGDIPDFQNRLFTEKNFDILNKLQTYAADHGHSMTELAIAWLLSNQCISTVICGATKAEQIAANVTAADWKLTSQEKTEIETIVTV